MKILSLTIHAAPGFLAGGPSLSMEALSPAANILYGPNGSGKTTIYRTLLRMLFPELVAPGLVRDELLQATTLWQTARGELQREVRGGMVATFPEQASWELSASLLSSVGLSLRDLLISEDLHLAQALAKEATGGYDLAGTLLGWRKEAGLFTGISEKALLKRARETLLEKEQETARLLREEQQLGQMEEDRRLLSDELARVRADLEQSLRRQQLTRDLLLCEEQLGQFPEGMELLAGHEWASYSALGRELLDLEQEREKQLSDRSLLAAELDWILKQPLIAGEPSHLEEMVSSWRLLEQELEPLRTSLRLASHELEVGSHYFGIGLEQLRTLDLATLRHQLEQQAKREELTSRIAKFATQIHLQRVPTLGGWAHLLAYALLAGALYLKQQTHFAWAAALGGFAVWGAVEGSRFAALRTLVRRQRVLEEDLKTVKELPPLLLPTALQGEGVARLWDLKRKLASLHVEEERLGILEQQREELLCKLPEELATLSHHLAFEKVAGALKMQQQAERLKADIARLNERVVQLEEKQIQLKGQQVELLASSGSAGQPALLQNRLEQLGSYRALKSRQQHLGEALSSLPPLVGEVEVSAKQAHLTSVEEALTALVREMGRIESRGHEARGKGELLQARRALAEAEQAQKRAFRSFARGALGAYLVQEVAGRFEREAAPQLFARASALLSRFTAGAYELRFPPMLSAASSGKRSQEAKGPILWAYEKRTGELRTLEACSSGTRVQILLALRLAFLLEEEPQADPLPILLDEALAQSDELRSRAIAEAMLSLAQEGRQLFFFTSKRTEVELWQEIATNLGCPLALHTLGAAEKRPQKRVAKKR